MPEGANAIQKLIVAWNKQKQDENVTWTIFAW